MTCVCTLCRKVGSCDSCHRAARRVRRKKAKECQQGSRLFRARHSASFRPPPALSACTHTTQYNVISLAAANCAEEGLEKETTPPSRRPNIAAEKKRSKRKKAIIIGV
jgi:hypothetical protein